MSGGSLGRKITGTAPNTRHPLIGMSGWVGRVMLPALTSARQSVGEPSGCVGDAQIARIRTVAVHRHSTAWPAQNGGSVRVLPRPSRNSP